MFDLCIHVDMSAVDLFLNIDQLSLLCTTSNSLLRWLVDHCTADPPAQDPSEVSHRVPISIFQYFVSRN